MSYLGSSRVVYLLLAVVAGCGSEGGTRPIRQYPDGMGGLASELPTGAAGATGNGAAGGRNEGVDTGLGLDPSGAAGSGPIDPSGAAQSLREAAALSGRLIGTALAANRLNDVAYAAAAREFNYVTPENEMKWDALEREPGQFSFNNADRIVAFAETNGMQVKGHTLVWHSQLPNWVRQLTTRDQVLQAMEQHVSSVVGQYRGRVQAWDVVNEAFTDGGNPRLRGSDPNDVNDPNNGNGNNGPDSIFRRLIGMPCCFTTISIPRALRPRATPCSRWCRACCNVGCRSMVWGCRCTLTRTWMASVPRRRWPRTSHV
jgi:glycosyl hydrolase family 10